MEIEFERRPRLVPVPRDTPAPWLGKRSHKSRVEGSWLVRVDGEPYTVPDGYITDKSTIPRPLWLIWPPNYSAAVLPAIFHDWCYSHGYRYVDKAWADKVFREFMVLEGAPRPVAWTFWAGVRANIIGGGWR